jgi:hypothetical protein
LDSISGALLVLKKKARRGKMYVLHQQAKKDKTPIHTNGSFSPFFSIDQMNPPTPLWLDCDPGKSS